MEKNGLLRAGYCIMVLQLSKINHCVAVGPADVAISFRDQLDGISTASKTRQATKNLRAMSDAGRSGVCNRLNLYFHTLFRLIILYSLSPEYSVFPSVA